MSDRMVEMAQAVGVELEPWQVDFLRRLPELGRFSLDARPAMRADRRRAYEMANLVAELTRTR